MIRPSSASVTIWQDSREVGFTSNALSGILSFVDRGRGRPATGRDRVIAIRLSDELRGAVDQWAVAQKITRSKAIRVLIEQGLKK